MADASISGDPQLASFIEQENQKQRFQTVVHTLTEQCWELCTPSVSSRLDGKTETCLQNCVERFIDSSNYIINKLGQEGAAAQARMGKISSDEFSSRDFSMGQPTFGVKSEFSSPSDSTSSFSYDSNNSYQNSSTQDGQKKSSWKFW